MPEDAARILRDRRKQLGMRTADVSRALRCSRRFVELVEVGARVPSYTTLHCWMNAIELDDHDRAQVAAIYDLVRPA